MAVPFLLAAPVAAQWILAAISLTAATGIVAVDAKQRADTGRGITEPLVEKTFDLFQGTAQATTSTTTSQILKTEITSPIPAPSNDEVEGLIKELGEKLDELEKLLSQGKSKSDEANTLVKRILEILEKLQSSLSSIKGETLVKLKNIIAKIANSVVMGYKSIKAVINSIIPEIENEIAKRLTEEPKTTPSKEPETPPSVPGKPGFKELWKSEVPLGNPVTGYTFGGLVTRIASLLVPEYATKFFSKGSESFWGNAFNPGGLGAKFLGGNQDNPQDKSTATTNTRKLKQGFEKKGERYFQAGTETEVAEEDATETTNNKSINNEQL